MTRKIIALSLALTSLMSGHMAHSQSLYFPPASGEWATMDPQELNWCSDRIDSLYQYLETNQSKAFVLLKDGKIVLESYFNGHSETANWYWASAAKTLTAFMVGQAQQQGLLDIDEPTSNYLGQGWTSCTPNQEQAITIRNQLTMTTGLNDGVIDDDCTESDCLEYLADAGSRWSYHNAPYTLLDSVMQMATGMTLNTWCFQNVAQPIGMQGLWLNIDYNNVYFSNARSMARYGLLLLAEGVWDGNDLLQDEQYFYDMTHVSQPLNEGYGYLTWLNNTDSFMFPESQFVFPGNLSPNAPMEMFAAIGRDGQYISVVPSQNLVWIRMGENPDGLDVPILMIDDIWQLINALPCSPNAVDLSQSKGMEVAPNPATTHWTIHSKSPIQSFKLSDMHGLTVQTGLTAGASSIRLDANHLPCGNYIATIYLQDGSVMRARLVKA
jgi:CubicO group peptidase (beta-lactamase class C family)